MLCPDCPDLLAENMPPGWTPRARCCRDEHIDRRLAGSFEPWRGIEQARKDSAEDEARLNRQQRRERDAKNRRKG